MKLLLVLALFVTSILSSPFALNDRDHENNFRRILNGQRYNFPCGWPDAGENGIPPLDPLFIQEVEIQQNSIATALTSTMTNINIRNLRNFDIRILNINSAARTFRYQFVVPLLTVDAHHNTRGRMIGIPVVSGSGPMTVRVTNGRVEGTLNWRELPGSGYMNFYNQTSNFDADNVVVQMNGFGLLTGTVNRQINEMIPEMIADPEMQKQFSQIVGMILLPIFNELAYHRTPVEVGQWLAYTANNLPPPNC